jgi:hypothetical protein
MPKHVRPTRRAEIRINVLGEGVLRERRAFRYRLWPVDLGIVQVPSAVTTAVALTQVPLERK